MFKEKTSVQWKDIDASYHLHPFTDFHEYETSKGRIIEKSEHIYIFDTDGRLSLIHI